MGSHQITILAGSLHTLGNSTLINALGAFVVTVDFAFAC